MLLKSLPIIMFGWWQVALAQTLSLSEPPPTSSGCVAPGAFDACVLQVGSFFTDCYNAALKLPTEYDQENGELVCYGARLESLLNCYLSSCWNEVYSCTYQWFASEFYINYVVPLSLVTPGSIPFYPAPDNAPAGCSCNVGKLFQNITSALEEQQTICGQEKSNPADFGGCICCSASAAFAAFYTFCPDTDENAILLPVYMNEVKSGAILSHCSGAYNAATCEKQYGLAPAAGGLALSINNLPAWTGTKPLSTLGGTITTPLGGHVLTWTAGGTTFTITATTAPSSSLSSTSVSRTTTKLTLSSASTGPTTNPTLSSTGRGTTMPAQTTVPLATTAPQATITTKNGSSTKTKTNSLLIILSLAWFLYIITECLF